MMARLLILVVSLLLCSCATNLSQTPQFPKLKMEGNRLVEPDYGYSVEIPKGWKMFDESSLEKFDLDSRKLANQELNRLRMGGVRAIFVEPSESTFLFITAAGGRYRTKEEVMTVWQKRTQDLIRAQNDRLGYAHIYNVEVNKFRELADANVSYETSDGRRMLTYVQAFSFRQSLYTVELSLSAVLSDFDSHLPLFYDCVNSLSVSGLSASPQAGKSDKAANERLEELKRLKEKGLITDEEYEKKKKQILDEL
jgi:hypothetical protein